MFKRPNLRPQSNHPATARQHHRPAYQHLIDGLPVTNSDDLKIERILGKGSFGHVSLCKRGNEVLVLKELMSNDEKSQCLFAKEAKLLHSVNHGNIVKFDSICFKNENRVRKIALLMEYSEFNFTSLGLAHSVSSLGDFLIEVDRHDCKQFEHLIRHIATDVCKGLRHLHGMDIVHRDLKPDNILVSNQHYTNLCEDEQDKYWSSEPIVAKLTDFGEGRAALVQTSAALHTATANVCRGSPAFMAPEIHQHDGRRRMDLSELKAADMWSFAMVMYTLINPSQMYPYQIELEEAQARGNPRPPWEMLRGVMSRRTLPRHTEKYGTLRRNTWSTVMSAYDMCAKFGKRPTAAIMYEFLCVDYTILEYLKACPTIEICHVLSILGSTSTCPAVRACPSCFTLIEHCGGCPKMNCPGCNTTFCFQCLSSDCLAFVCRVAPIQTSLGPGV